MPRENLLSCHNLVEFLQFPSYHKISGYTRLNTCIPLALRTTGRLTSVQSSLKIPKKLQATHRGIIEVSQKYNYIEKITGAKQLCTASIDVLQHQCSCEKWLREKLRAI